MEYQKITNLLDATSDNVPRFITKIWTEVHDRSGGSYNACKQIRFKTSILRSDLCDYSDAYIVVKATITVQPENNRAIDGYNRNLILKNNALFIKCILKIKNVLIDNAEDLHVVMHMYKSADPTTNSESFKYKTSITEKTANDGNKKEVEFSVPLKHLSNFWKTLNMPLFYCEVSLTLTWSKNCVITDETTKDANPNANPHVPESRAPTGVTFKITDTNL